MEQRLSPATEPEVVTLPNLEEEEEPSSSLTESAESSTATSDEQERQYALDFWGQGLPIGRRPILYLCLSLLLMILGGVLMISAGSSSLALVPILIPFLTLLYLQATRRRAVKRMIERAAGDEDKTAIGLILDTMARLHLPPHEGFMQTLTPLLPTLRSSDAALLNAEQRQQLYHLMLDKKRPMRGYAQYLRIHQEFTIAALLALQQIGDAEAIPTVQQLTESPDARIREAAQDCLLFLETHAANVRASQTLLRAAHPTDASTPPTELLRAAKGTPSTTAPEQLLRASDSSPD